MLSQNEKVHIGMIRRASDCGTHCLFASQTDFQIWQRRLRLINLVGNPSFWLCVCSLFSAWSLYKGTELIVAKWWEQVYGWGRGEHGRLGFGDDKSSKMIPQKAHTLESEFIVQVYFKHFHADMFGCWIWIVEKTNYTLRFSWEQTLLLTVLSFQNYNTVWCPVFWQVACGGTHSVALTNDGRIFSVSIFTLSQSWLQVATCGVCSRITPDRCFFGSYILQSFQLNSWCIMMSLLDPPCFSQTICVCLSVCSMGEVITAVLDLEKRSRQATLWKCQCICHLQRKRSLIWASVTKTRMAPWRSREDGVRHL